MKTAAEPPRMAMLGVCTNAPRCSKARDGEQVDFYPGFGEVCPECGRALTKIAPEQSAATPAHAASPRSEVNGGGRATVVPPPAVAPDPVPRPRRLITGHSPSDALPRTDPPPRAEPPRAEPPPERTPAPAPPAASDASAIPAFPPEPSPAATAIPPIVPLRPEAAPPEAQPVPSAAQAAALEPEPVAPAPVAVAPVPAATPMAPPVPPATEPARAAPAPRVFDDAPNRWYIPTPERVDHDDDEPATLPGAARRSIPRSYIFTGLGVALLAALGTFVFNLAGPLIGSRTTAAAAAFHMCGSRAVAGRLGTNLAKAFFAKLGASSVTVSPYGSSGLVVAAKVPGRWQPQSIAIDMADDSSTIGSLTGKVCQVGMVASSIDNRATLANSGILGKVIGYDASVVITNPSNGIGRLSSGQLAGIFGGSVTNWSQLGGSNAPIAVFAPDQPGHYLAAFRRSVLGGSSLPRNARILGDQAAVSTSVARDRNAIGFVGFVFADPGHVIKLAGSDGTDVLPTAATIGQRHYPLTIPVYLYNVAQQTEPLVFDFVDFARSDAGQTIVEDNGYVSRLSL